MFETFTFGTPRSTSIDSNNTSSRSVSPCSETSSYPSESCSVTDLAALLQRQQLHQQSQIYSQPCDSYANLADDESAWSVEAIEIPPARRPRSGSPQSFSLCRRRDRQINTRLLCSATHHRDIASLVASMITQHEQCLVSPPTSMPILPLQVDEEDSEDSLDMEPLSRQSSTVSITRTRDYRRHKDARRPGTSICKDIRLRKDKARKPKSSER